MSDIAAEDAKKWVSYLSQLGPSSSNNNLFDEKLVVNIRKLRITPIEIANPLDAPLLATVRNLIADGTSAVILLAGMAGDGKTRTARKLWEALTQGDADMARRWNDERFPFLVLKTQKGVSYQIDFVKDLSHTLDTDSRGNDNPWSITHVPGNTCRVIACNHGKLLDFIRTTGSTDTPEEAKKAEDLANILEQAFFARKMKDMIAVGDIQVHLFDLSVYNPAEKFESILSQVCGRQEWKGCSQCLYSASCHIGANRRALWDDDKQQLKTAAHRQTELIRLVGCSGVHLPIRDLLLLAVNDLLGTHEFNKPRLRKRLQTCSAVEEAQNLGKQIESYVYCNLLGENLPNQVQRENLVFSELARFGIGTHAPRLFDRMLMAPVSQSQNVMDFVEPSAAAALWNVPPQSENPGSAIARELLKMRRQAMFFCIPDGAKPDRWQLTAFSFGGDYLQLLSLPPGKPQSAQSNLIVGMNRVFTGQFRMEESKLLITTAGTESGSLQGELLQCNIDVRPRLRRSSGTSGIFIGTNETGGLSLQFFDAGQCIVKAPLTPPLYEFFRRQASGYVISGFTRECWAQAFQLKSRLINEYSPTEDAIGYGQEMTIDLLPMTDTNAVQIILKN